MKNIRLGNDFYTKYLNELSFNFEEVPPAEGFIKGYFIWKNAPLYKAYLNVLPDGRAILNANYTTFSGVKNKYKVYFDKQGREIIHANDNTAQEKKYFESLKNKDGSYE